jgi:hypothetical protein
VHLSSHSRIIKLGGLLLKFHALISVRNLVNLLACSVWAMRCITMLWHDILRPFMRGFSHVERRWGHASLSLMLGGGCYAVDCPSFM